MQEMEAPECPVCLQCYDDDNRIPRVLGCGHSACQTCLAHLHHHQSSSSSSSSSSSTPLSHTLRCPSCTQLVKFPHPQGPTALPKNIDLLRFSSQNPISKPTQQLHSRPFAPQNWSHHLYAAWNHWILPQSALFIQLPPPPTTTTTTTTTTTGRGRITLASNFIDFSLSPLMRCRLIQNQEVGLVPIARFELNDPFFTYSYVGKIMGVLSLMSDAQRDQISSLLGLCFRVSSVSNLLGLWLDVDNDGFLYLVSERMKDGFFDFGSFAFQVGQDNVDSWCSLGLLGAELCEAFISLHSEGFVCGCLGLSCLCFDEFGHVYVDLGEALVTVRKFRECVFEKFEGGEEIDGSEVEALIVKKMSNMDAFFSPEVLFELLCRESFEVGKNDGSCTVCYGSDVWLLACLLIRFLIGKQFPVDMYNYSRVFFQEKNEGIPECKIVYLQWVETINALLEPLLVGAYASVHEILLKCLDFDPRSRPLVTDVWKCIKGLDMYPSFDHVSSLNSKSMKENVGQCLVFGELCNTRNGLRNGARVSKLLQERDDCKHDLDVAGEARVENVVKGLSEGTMQCRVLQGHLDCITGLCAGGGYLFSSSFDKTINVWSLQDFTHVHTFRGHEHKVMALIFVNQEKPLCISADNGGGIFAWEVNESFSQEPLKKWYEEKDWRYSGIHALAVSETGCLYTGSGDRLIKAWLLRDHTLLCSMEGHKSVVSALALCNGVLYSGSWDGTIRLWCLHDHIPLAVFNEESPGTMSSVLSLFADPNMIIAAHENGYIKIWMNDVLKTSIKYHNGAIFALAMEGKWLFLGGWDRTVKVQEITGGGPEMDIVEVGSIACDSVITAMLCVQGILFVGCANKRIKNLDQIIASHLNTLRSCPRLGYRP